MAPKQRTATQPKKKATQKKDFDAGRRTGIWIFSFAVLVVITVTFIGAPVVSRTGQGGNLVFGSYDGRSISYSQGNYFDHQKNSIAQQLQASGRDTNSQAEVYQVWREAFIRTAFHEAVMAQAARSGLVVSQSEIDDQLARYPEFLDQNGQFSVQKYNQASNADKFRLRRYLGQQLTQQQYLQDELTGIHVSPKAVDFVTTMASPERRFDFVSYSYSDFPDSKVIEYGKANAKKFQRINLSAITINSNEEEASAIHEQLVNNTASFADLARAHSADMYAQKGGDMGWTHYFELAPDFSDPSVLDNVFKLKAGQISNVLKTTYGWVIYRVNEPAQQPDFTNKDTLKTVRNYMESFERGIIEDYLVALEKTIKKNAANVGLTAAALANGKNVALTDFFPINYGNEPIFGAVKAVDQNQPVSSGASREDFFRQLFSLKGKEISDPIVLSNHVMIFRLADQRNAKESAVKNIKTNMPQILQQFQSQDIQSAIFDPSRLIDNFNKMYNKYIYTPTKK